jgi:hypothetical protein
MICAAFGAKSSTIEPGPAREVRRALRPRRGLRRDARIDPRGLTEEIGRVRELTQRERDLAGRDQQSAVVLELRADIRQQPQSFGQSALIPQPRHGVEQDAARFDHPRRGALRFELTRAHQRVDGADRVAQRAEGSPARGVEFGRIRHARQCGGEQRVREFRLPRARRLPRRLAHREHQIRAGFVEPLRLDRQQVEERACRVAITPLSQQPLGFAQPRTTRQLSDHRAESFEWNADAGPIHPRRGHVRGQRAPILSRHQADDASVVVHQHARRLRGRLELQPRATGERVRIAGSEPRHRLFAARVALVRRDQRAGFLSHDGVAAQALGRRHDFARNLEQREVVRGVVARDAEHVVDLPVAAADGGAGRALDRRQRREHMRRPDRDRGRARQRRVVLGDSGETHGSGAIGRILRRRRSVGRDFVRVGGP